MNNDNPQVLIKALLQPGCYKHPVSDIKLVETHISWVVLTGDFAYKIKKPVNFGFLDFSTLTMRRHYCEEELRLNQRTAADIYIAVVPIMGSPNSPLVGNVQMEDTENEKVLEYAVKMRQFPQHSQMDRLLEAGELDESHIDALATRVAEFHASVSVAADTTHYGRAEFVLRPVLENFSQIRKSLGQSDSVDQLDLVEHWTNTEFKNIASQITRRREQGFVRECHGDLHLKNLAWVNNEPVAFDCIEFNADLRWIDVMSDLAFLIMDLQDREQHGFARRLLNRYLEISGDYAGLAVLRFYLVYRALVRAKVDLLQLGQGELKRDSRNALIKEFRTYLDLAVSQTHDTTPSLLITHGPSASGKSTFSQQLLQKSGVIRLRSDVERKRLFTQTHNPAGAVHFNNDADTENGDLYSAEFTQHTYSRLLDLSAQILGSGYSVIVDATFQRYSDRCNFQKLAQTLGVPYFILEFEFDVAQLRDRITKRKDDVSDAGITVLEKQISRWEPLRESEHHFKIDVNPDSQSSSVVVDEINRQVAV